MPNDREDFSDAGRDDRKKVITVVVAIGVIAIMFIVAANVVKRLTMEANKPVSTIVSTVK